MKSSASWRPATCVSTSQISTIRTNSVSCDIATVTIHWESEIRRLVPASRGLDRTPRWVLNEIDEGASQVEYTSQPFRESTLTFRSYVQHIHVTIVHFSTRHGRGQQRPMILSPRGGVKQATHVFANAGADENGVALGRAPDSMRDPIVMHTSGGKRLV